mmetsp:Transcript_128142/g.370987  ORF Transcript_128142/g.370987 Transcript_128142/m.370987 type:complete len:159 (-) Transcript_128142:488-964(-)|eukprot:CAMPEP_0176052242 /NCGR_PEP_ID=MMETSP0120_2-20121206/25975_1 /TAXON_ID=160619 /ORGANISM="Kryptoperidinium foliaceum, Strain CCMP 1326" /LENGTH=158 /DNA_ID=CAMNT_0017385683 /DNA_START=80 /DNA_END=556 /DNA_ORIENTATION=+
MYQKSIILSCLLSLALFLGSSTTTALVSPSLARHQQHRSMAASTTMLAASTILAPPTRESATEPAKKASQRHDQKQGDEDLWEVRLYNDQVNTHEWVAKCLVLVAGTTEWQAYQTTKLAHQEGQAHLGLYDKEIAETYTQGLREQGIVVQMFPTGNFQ